MATMGEKEIVDAIEELQRREESIREEKRKLHRLLGELRRRSGGVVQVVSGEAADAAEAKGGE